MNKIKMNIWDKYTQKEKIGFGSYSKVYKAQNKETGKYVAIKEIDKERIENQKYLTETEIMKKLNSENSVRLKETFDSNDFFYIIMDLCAYNLTDYVKIRETPLSIDEIRQILIQLNNTFKIMINNNIIHTDLKPSNILIYLDTIDKCTIKLSDYGSSNFINNLNSRTSRGTPLTMAPEVLNGKELSNKSDIWSLGIIIYFLLFKEYPYNGNNEVLLFNDINSGKKLKNCENKELNDLMNKMLKINVKERISWEEYFNHSFFKQNEIKDRIPQFNFLCEIHSKNINFYCKECKINICEDCINKHNKHEIKSFSKIGLTNEEINEIENINKEITYNMDKLNKMKDNITFLINQMKLIKDNNSIYENNSSNNYKKYYIDCLHFINEKIKIEGNMELIELKDEILNNFIIAEYYINNDKINDEIQILNCFEEVENEKSGISGMNNKIDLIKKCELYLNDEKIDFCFKYKFPKEGKYKIKIICKNRLISTNYLFYDCSSLISIDLSHFNTDNITDMNSMFDNCTILSVINLLNLHTNNAITMYSMFYKCSSLINLDLSNLNTENVINMSYMFSKCYSLNSLNLSDFKTGKVTNMAHMFQDCTSLTKLIISNFQTNIVTQMNNIFCNCSSLTSLNISSFNTENVTDMNGMFSKCTSLTSLDLTNFNTSNVTKMNAMFQICISLKSLNLTNFNTNKVSNMSYMFSYCESLTIINLSSFNTENVIDMNNMFSYCSSLSSLDLSNFNTNKVENMKSMFEHCISLLYLNISNFRKINKNSKGIFNDLNQNCKIIFNNEATFLKDFNY